MIRGTQCFVRGILCSLGLGTGLAVGACAWAGTWYVDDSVSESGNGSTPETAFKKIQEAIDTATHGDTVTVMPGIYFQNIMFKGKNISLTSTNPYDWATVENTYRRQSGWQRRDF